MEHLPSYIGIISGLKQPGWLNGKVIASGSVLRRKDIVFPDFDLDETDLGGVLEWQEPDNTAQVAWWGAVSLVGLVVFF